MTNIKRNRYNTERRLKTSPLHKRTGSTRSFSVALRPHQRHSETTWQSQDYDSVKQPPTLGRTAQTLQRNAAREEVQKEQPNRGGRISVKRREGSSNSALTSSAVVSSYDQRLLHWQNCTVTAAVTETLTFYSSATKICSSSGVLYTVTVWLTR